MTSHLHRRSFGPALGLVAALAGTAAWAAAPDLRPSEPPLIVAQAPQVNTGVAPGGFQVSTNKPMQAGLMRAAAEGPDALRRYIWRTRMIYNYYIWDYAKSE